MKIALLLIAVLGIWFGMTYHDTSILSFLPAKLTHAILVYKAEGGDDDAMIELGENFEEGITVDRDIGQALGWYKRALFRGNPKAYYHLGRLALHGTGLIKQNLPFAIEYLHKAAEHAVPSAHFSLGMAHERGLGFDQSLDNAYFHYYMAELLESSDGTRNKFRIAQSIPYQTRTKLEDRAHEQLQELAVMRIGSIPVRRQIKMKFGNLRDFFRGKTLDNLKEMESNAGTLDPMNNADK